METFEGPSLEELNTPFSVVEPLSVSQAEVDFSTSETVFFTASFSKTMNWELAIIGETSGAVKRVQGTSKEVNAETFIWAGETTELPLFRMEDCTVHLTFTDVDDTLSTTVNVTGVKTNEGFLVADFDGGFNPGWTSFIQSGADMDFQIKDDGGAAEGDAYYNMAGEVNWDWLIGLVNFNADAYGETHFPLSTNPDNVYFNVMIYGMPGLNTSRVLFQFEEDENGDGSFSSADEDMYAHEVVVDWDGWQLVSLKYSDIVSLDNGVPVPAAGNNTHNPDRILKVNMLHLANPDLGYAKSKLDYIIFTENGPLLP
jgi:hypothetical protein